MHFTQSRLEQLLQTPQFPKTHQLHTLVSERLQRGLVRWISYRQTHNNIDIAIERGALQQCSLSPVLCAETIRRICHQSPLRPEIQPKNFKKCLSRSVDRNRFRSSQFFSKSIEATQAFLTDDPGWKQYCSREGRANRRRNSPNMLLTFPLYAKDFF